MHSSRHREEILNSEFYGCFYCLMLFRPTSIERWIDPNENNMVQTALCPECTIDSVIGSESGFPITKDFLTQMQNY